MSMNIYVEGYPGNFPWQTPTSVSYEVVRNLKGRSPLEQDLEVIERLRSWIHGLYDPKPLVGKDARNTYLVQRREEEVQELDNRVNEVVLFIRYNSKGKRLVGIS